MKNLWWEWGGSCWGENFNINVQNWTEKKLYKTTKSGFELKGQFTMGCQWRATWVKVWIKHDCMKSGYELKGQFNMGHQLNGVVSEMTVRIIWGVQISEGQIIRAILYKRLVLGHLRVVIQEKLSGFPKTTKVTTTVLCLARFSYCLVKRFNNVL